MSRLLNAWRVAVGILTTGIPEELRKDVPPVEEQEWPDHGDCCSF